MWKWGINTLFNEWISQLNGLGNRVVPYIRSSYEFSLEQFGVSPYDIGQAPGQLAIMESPPESIGIDQSNRSNIPWKLSDS